MLRLVQRIKPSGALLHLRPYTTASSAHEISLTETCAKRVADIGKYLRVSVDGGGCSGFVYNFTFEEGPQQRDLLIESLGAKVLVDPESLPFLKGSTIDYQKEMISSSFRIQSNPNSSSNCGCGRSFNPGS